MAKKEYQKKKRPISGRKPAIAVAPHTVKHALDYGEFDWMDRDELGWVRFKTTAACSHFNMSSQRLKECLYSLENWELVAEVRWNRYYVEVKRQIPKGMALIIEARTITAPEHEIEYFDAAEEYKVDYNRLERNG